MPVYIRDAGIWKDVSGGGGGAGGTFEAGTRLLFIQANAPTGWAKESNVAFNNAALRIVTGSGGGVVDGSAFTAVFASRAVPLPQHSHSGTTNNQSANHTHTGSTGGHSVDHSHTVTLPNASGTSGSSGRFYANNPSGTTSWTTSGTSANHSHSFTTDGVSSDHNHTFGTSSEGTAGATMNFAVRYVDAIICTKQ